MSCPLCHSKSLKEYDVTGNILFLECDQCSLLFKPSKFFPSIAKEKARYLLHENDVEDLHYQQFVAPIVNVIIQKHSPSKKGLDFGAGTGPVIAKLLTGKGYHISLYDPFFHPDKSVLSKRYDFIICCEVMEHFHVPFKEFELLRKLLKPKGNLYCMTQLLPKKSEFENWNYRNDPTHVVFYSESSLNWIKEHFGFSGVTINKRLIVFKT